jgi:hypothetical protein
VAPADDDGHEQVAESVESLQAVRAIGGRLGPMVGWVMLSVRT